MDKGNARLVGRVTFSEIELIIILIVLNILKGNLTYVYCDFIHNVLRCLKKNDKIDVARRLLISVESPILKMVTTLLNFSWLRKYL